MAAKDHGRDGLVHAEQVSPLDEVYRGPRVVQHIHDRGES